MAKRKKGEVKEIKIVTRRKENQERVYSNYVEVTTSPFDTSLRFADVKTPTKGKEMEQVKNKGEIEVPVLVEIVMPREVAYGLLGALGKQLTEIQSDNKEER